MQRTGASRFGQRQFERYWRLTPAADVGRWGHFHAMKQTYSILLLASVLVGCRSTNAPDPTDVPAWN